MDGHDDGCECKRCDMVRGYVEMGELNLSIANTYAHLEDEVAAMEV